MSMSIVICYFIFLYRQEGNMDDGVYTITLSNISVNVYCDMSFLLYRLSIPLARRQHAGW